MRKIFNILFIFVLGFIFITEVNASTVTWEDISEDLKLYLEEDYDAIVTKNNNNFKAVIEDFEYDDGITLSSYTFELNYQNNIISLIIKDTSNLNKNEKFIKGYLDLDILDTLFIIMNENYENSNFELLTSIEDKTLSNYGIELDFKNISTEDDNSLDISKFSVNLNTFDNSIKSNVSNDKEKEETPEVDGDVSTSEQTTTDTTNDKDPVSKDELPDNPSTGDSTIYIIVSFLVLCIGLIIYKFKSLDNYNSL